MSDRKGCFARQMCNWHQVFFTSEWKENRPMNWILTSSSSRQNKPKQSGRQMFRHLIHIVVILIIMDLTQITVEDLTAQVNSQSHLFLCLKVSCGMRAKGISSRVSCIFFSLDENKTIISSILIDRFAHIIKWKECEWLVELFVIVERYNSRNNIEHNLEDPIQRKT